MKARKLFSILSFISVGCLTLAQTLPTTVAAAQTESPAQTRYQRERVAFMSVGNDGAIVRSKNLVRVKSGPQLLRRNISAPKGLDGRHIALWQSHGRYFNLSKQAWEWQRPPLFQTTEDLFTQSFVVPFLAPMLENAGASVFLPRERDYHRCEIIIDNDQCENCSGRIHGKVEFSGKWRTHGEGFADRKCTYSDEDNPFTLGTALSCPAVTSSKSNISTVGWYANIPKHDEYAVYVSYSQAPGNITDARYTIHTAGGPVQVKVNQRMGGGTWIYLGTYEFEAGESLRVSLSNLSAMSGTVTADAVKIGGGMGNIARGIRDSTEYVVSGLPRFAEGARYFLQWSGIPSTVWSQNDANDDYRDDLMCRGSWVQYLCGGSWVNPKKNGLNIPIDMSFAWHSDAGSRPDDSIVGTLGIYTLRCGGRTRFPSGHSRSTSRELTELLLSQIETDLSCQWDSLWTIRDVWNKSYSESRTTGVPAVLLELLSHQNFEDMKFGLDPTFRFTAARACYKAILKYLSMHYGRPYVVQPLPVKAFGARLDCSGEQPMAQLSWMAQTDTLEPTAKPESFIVYTRVDGSGWDQGRKVKAISEDGIYRTCLPISRGHIYSYKLVAANEGGVSFPSEIMSVGMPDSAQEAKGKVSIVNAFHRVSGPKWFDTPSYAGFDTRSDSGVPYLADWAYIGEQFEFNRCKDYNAKTGRGFGESYEEYAGTVVGGNSFDYPYIHGRALLECGYAFDSCSDELTSFEPSFCDGSCSIDIICGKECKVKTAARSPERGGIYSKAMLSLLRKAVSDGRNIIISGAYIAKEAAESSPEVQKFVADSLGFTLRREHGSRSGKVSVLGHNTQTYSFPCSPEPDSYCVESPDALASYRMGSSIYLIYTDTRLAAGVLIPFHKYKVAAFGFPLEILRTPSSFSEILHIMSF